MVVFCGLSALLALPVARSIPWRRLTGDFDQAMAILTQPDLVSHAVGVLGMWIALWWIYIGAGWGLLGATPGKWLFGLRVADLKGRWPIGMSRAILRLVAYMVSSLTLGVGHLLILFRSDRQALHDLLAGTRIIRR
jgi:uncharacterized RDD family membrane protein YckC